jgi:phage tail-like protein
MRDTRQLRLPPTERHPPRSASERSYLRVGLPAIYQEPGSFGMRLLEALEEVLDPVVALLDSLPRLFDPGQAPDDVLDLLSAWLGLEHHEAMPAEQRRELIARAAEISARRGTQAGLELGLALNFPGIPLRVEDGGCVNRMTTLETLGAASGSGFVVYCDAQVPPQTQREIAHFINREKPAHIPFKLRVKAAKPAKPATEEAS